ncbi:MAG TPA: SURF1 family protein [Devosia sp.]
MSRGLRIGFIVLMLALTAVFGWLGTWQLQRLGEKEALIAAVEQRVHADTVPLPAAAEWQNPDTYLVDPATGAKMLFGLTFRTVSVAGTYIPGATVLVFTSLSDAKGSRSGPGYWVMTPLALDGGGTVFINRGFVPQADSAAYRGTTPPGPQQLTGVVRSPEAAGSFTPEPDVGNGIDWVRDPARLAALAGDLPQPVLPITIDLPAGPPGSLPQGGETVVEFPNNHLGYAITWYGFAILTPILLVFWLVRQRKGGAVS